MNILRFVISPLPFIVFLPEKSKLLSVRISIYYITVLISTQFKNFPVPVDGI